MTLLVGRDGKEVLRLGCHGTGGEALEDLTVDSGGAGFVMQPQQGMRLGDGPTGQIQAWRITNRSTGRSVVEAPLPSPSDPRNWAGRDMRVSGTVTRVLTGRTRLV